MNCKKVKSLLCILFLVNALSSVLALAQVNDNPIWIKDVQELDGSFEYPVFSHDGRILGVTRVKSSRDSGVISDFVLFDAQTGEELLKRRVTQTGPMFFTPDGQYVIWRGDSTFEKVRLTDFSMVLQFEVVRPFEDNWDPKYVLSSDGKQLLSYYTNLAKYQDTVYQWDVTSGLLVAKHLIRRDPRYSSMWLHLAQLDGLNDRIWICGSCKYYNGPWDYTTYERAWFWFSASTSDSLHYYRSDNSRGGVIFSEDMKLIAFAEDKTNSGISITDSRTFELISNIPSKNVSGGSSHARGQFSGDTRYLLMMNGGSEPNSWLELIDVEKQKCVDTILFSPTIRYWPEQFAISRTGQYIASCLAGLLHVYQTNFVSATTEPESKDREKKITLYPNPATNRVTLTSGLISVGSIKVHYCMLSDKRYIQLESDKYMIDKDSLDIDVGSFVNGTYLIKIEAAGKTETFKLVVLR